MGITLTHSQANNRILPDCNIKHWSPSNSAKKTNKQKKTCEIQKCVCQNICVNITQKILSSKIQLFLTTWKQTSAHAVLLSY